VKIYASGTLVVVHYVGSAVIAVNTGQGSVTVNLSKLASGLPEKVTVEGFGNQIWNL
jgi:hypothetical protein